MFLFFPLIIWGMQTTSTSEENVTGKHRKREEWRSATVPECEDNWDTGHVQKDNPTCNIRLQKLNKFSFLGKTVSSDTRSLHEIKIRIAAAKLAFTDKILINQQISSETRQSSRCRHYTSPHAWKWSTDIFFKKCKNHQCSRNVVHQTD